MNESIPFRRMHTRPMVQAPAVIAAALLLAALVLGVLATTADALVIGIGVGAICGLFLLAMPRMLVWLVLVLGLVSGALLSLAGPSYTRLAWPVSLVAFLLWPLALIHLTQQKRIPPFIWIAMSFVLFCVLATFLRLYSIAEFVAGFKRYFQAYGLLFALAALPFMSDDMRRWKRLLLAIALLQLPFALYEFLVLVPLRGGLEAGSDATDVVAGTFGANLNGGSANAEMAVFLLITLGFLLARSRAGLISPARALMLGLVCMAPFALGETKVIVLLLPLAGLIIMRKDFYRAPLRYLPGLIILLLLAAALAWVYVALMMRGTFTHALDDTMRYNLESVGYGDALLNRSTALSFWWERHGWHDPVGMLFGHGIGSSYWSSDNLVAGHIGMRYPRYGIDLTTLSTLLWDCGLVGAVMYSLILIFAWVAANGLLRRTDDPGVRADALAIQAAIAIFAVFVVYSNTSVSLQSFQIVIAAVLGYLAFLCRTENPITSPDKRQS